MLRRLLCVVCLSVLVPAATPAGLENIIAHSLAARGGIARFNQLRTLLSRAHLLLPNGQTITLKIYSERPNRLCLELTLPGGKRLLQGYDGKTAWQLAPGSAHPTVLAGAAARQVIDQATFADLLLDNPAQVSGRALAGSEVRHGRRCTLVQTTLRTGDRFTQCIDDASGLAVHEEIVMGGGRVPIEETISQYQRIAGVLLPFRYRSGAKGSSRRSILHIDSIEANRPMPPGLFRMPG